MNPNTVRSSPTRAARLESGVWPDRRPTVLLADDHAIITEGLRHLLEPECEILATVGDGEGLVEKARELCPDIVVTDITMPRLNSIAAIRKLLQARPKTRAIFLTMHVDRVYVAEVFDAGAVGFVVKHAASGELWQAINAVLRGSTFVSPLVGGNGSSTDRHQPHLAETIASYRLTARQNQIVRLVAEGHSIKQIAIRLKLAPKTVEFHKYRAIKSLRLESSAQLIQFALKCGLIA